MVQTSSLFKQEQKESMQTEQQNISRVFGKTAYSFNTPTISVDTYMCTICLEHVVICLGESKIECPKCQHKELSRIMPQTRTYIAQ